MTQLWPSLLGATQVVQPETILRWHRAGFKAFWRWKSRKRAGRPKIDRGLRDLIQRMSKENQQWCASRIHGEPPCPRAFAGNLEFASSRRRRSQRLPSSGSPSKARPPDRTGRFAGAPANTAKLLSV